jgi:uncharacterized integral membrane protein
MQLATIFAIGFALVSVAFAFQNSTPVSIVLVVWRIDTSLAVALLSAMGLGAIVTALLTTPTILKLQWAARRGRKQAVALEKQLTDAKVATRPTTTPSPVTPVKPTMSANSPAETGKKQ